MTTTTIHDAERTGDLIALLEMLEDRRKKEGRLHRNQNLDSSSSSSFHAYINQGRIKDGRSPLIIAAMYNQFEAVKLLLRYGADADQHQNSQSMTALYWACARGNVRIVQVLLQHHASVFIRTSAGTTPLHRAAWKGDVEIVKCLLQHHHREQQLRSISSSEKEDWVNAEDQRGETALYKAIVQHHADVVELLLGFGGADPSRVLEVAKNDRKRERRRRFIGLLERSEDVEDKDDVAAAKSNRTSMNALQVAEEVGDKVCMQIIQDVLKETKRTTLLHQARLMNDHRLQVHHLLDKEGGRGAEAARERSFLQQQQVEGGRGKMMEVKEILAKVPYYLRARVMNGEDLPVVDVCRDGVRYCCIEGGAENVMAEGEGIVCTSPAVVSCVSLSNPDEEEGKDEKDVKGQVHATAINSDIDDMKEVRMRGSMSRAETSVEVTMMKKRHQHHQSHPRRQQQSPQQSFSSSISRRPSSHTAVEDKEGAAVATEEVLHGVLKHVIEGDGIIDDVYIELMRMMSAQWALPPSLYTHDQQRKSGREVDEESAIEQRRERRTGRIDRIIGENSDDEDEQDF